MISVASTLLQIALTLLLSLQSNPSVSESTRDQAFSVANQAIQIANKVLTNSAYLQQIEKETISGGPVSQMPTNKIDVLLYLLKDNYNFTRGLSSSDQSFYWHQKLGQDKDFYLVKWNNPGQTVHYRYDNNKIYLVTDSTGVHPYKFNPGVWVNRIMQVGETIDMSVNTMQSLTNDCRVEQENRGWPYKITLEDHYPIYDLGGDLGKQDVIVLKYQWGDGFRNIEREYYAKGYGIVKWEHEENGVIKQSVLTNKVFDYSLATPKPLCYDLNGNNLKIEQKVPTVPTTSYDFVKHLYSCVLKNDNPDESGVDYWLSNLKNKSLTMPQAYTYIYGYQSGLSNADFVSTLYHCILFRSPDTDGYNYWLNILESGQDSRANQVQYILNSSGFTSSILLQLKSLLP